jgi:hypothetical protein
MKRPRLGERHGWVAWAIFGAVICFLIWHQPGRRSQATGYLATTEAYWAAESDIYTPGIKGFLYLPQSLYVLTPFTWPERNVGNALWRIAGLLLLAFGVRRWAALCARDREGEVFALATLLMLCASFAATRTGQANLHLAGCMLHAGADLAQRRWWRATLLLWLGMAIKPLGIVLLLLAAALYRPMRGRLAAGLLLFAVLPLAHPDLDYAWRQYGLAFEKIARSNNPGTKPYADLVGLLRSLGWEMPVPWRMPVQAAAALGALALSWLALRRRGPVRGSLAVVTFAACYLMLFNARNETNSYVILVPHVALAAARAFGAPGRRARFALLLAACAALGADNYGRAFHGWTSPWLKPLAAILFLAWLVPRALREDPQPQTAERRTA